MRRLDPRARARPALARGDRTVRAVSSQPGGIRSRLIADVKESDHAGEAVGLFHEPICRRRHLLGGDSVPLDDRIELRDRGMNPVGAGRLFVGSHEDATLVSQEYSPLGSCRRMTLISCPIPVLLSSLGGGRLRLEALAVGLAFDD